MRFWEYAGEQSWSGKEGLLSRKDLGIEERLVGLEKSFAVSES